MKFLVQSQFEMERHSGLTGILSRALNSITYLTLINKVRRFWSRFACQNDPLYSGLLLFLN